MKHTMISLSLFLAACSSTPELQTGPDAEKNEAGLVKVEHSLFDKAFAMPGANLQEYSEFIFEPLSFDGMEVIDPELTRSQRSSWDFTEKDAAQFSKAYESAIERYFGVDDELQATSTPGKAVATVKTRITRFAPTTPKYDSIDMGPRDTSYARSSAYITIASDIYDSVSGTLVASIEDNREMGDHTEMREITYAQYGMDIKTTFGRWADKLAKQLSELKNVK